MWRFDAIFQVSVRKTNHKFELNGSCLRNEEKKVQQKVKEQMLGLQRMNSIMARFRRLWKRRLISIREVEAENLLLITVIYIFSLAYNVVENICHSEYNNSAVLQIVRIDEWYNCQLIWCLNKVFRNVEHKYKEKRIDDVKRYIKVIKF